MDRVLDYLAMGGYARFVWPAFGVAAIVLIGLLVQSMRAHAARQRELEALQGGRGER